MENKSKALLREVVILRPICIFLLILYHSFIIYTGGWKAPVGFFPVESYRWIAELSYSFMLQLFVLLSGYIFGYQLYDLKREFTIKGLILSKFNRLLVPSLFFGIVYFFMFYEYTDLKSFLLKVLSGVGHMWFLPMLFWCFIVGYGLYKWQSKEIVKFVISFILIFLSIIPIPFGISPMFNYLFFFYFGIFLYRKRRFFLIYFHLKIYCY